MKKYSKITVAFGVVAVITLGILFQGNLVTIPNKLAVSPDVVVKTFKNSQVDTVTWYRQAGVSGASFAAHFKDSVNVTSVAVWRGVDGVYLQPGTTVAKDSIVEFRNFSCLDNKAAPDTVMVGTLQLTPIADSYRFVVTYAASGNGVVTPTVVYEVIKQFSK